MQTKPSVQLRYKTYLTHPGKFKFDRIEFTGASDLLSFEEARLFAKEKGLELQSLAEAAVFRIADNGTNSSAPPQITRTVCVYYANAPDRFSFPGFYMAIYDHPDIYKNVDYNHLTRGGLYPLKNTFITSAIVEYSRQKKRVVEVMHGDRTLELSLNDEDEDLPSFRQNGMVKALLGDAADLYADFLHEKGYETCTVCNLLMLESERGNMRENGLAKVGLAYLCGAPYGTTNSIAIISPADMNMRGIARGVYPPLKEFWSTSGADRTEAAHATA